MTVKPRLFISAFLALPMLSACETMQEIDRGLYSATEAVTERDTITGQRTLSLQDRKQQIEKGNEFAEQLIVAARTSDKRLNEDYSLAAYERIKRIFFRLHQVSHVRDEQWTPVLIEDKEWNAFTTGGTYFVINSGLEEDLSDDSELANVIAHEMAHSVANHLFERASYLHLNALGGSKSAKRETFRDAFTHENEAEADRVAVLYCALAGYDPFAGARIWQRKHQRSGDNALLVHNHPMNSERAARAQKVASQVSKYYVSGEINPEFAAILANNPVYATEAESKVDAGKGGGVLAALDAALNSVQQQQQAKLEEQRQQLRIEFMRAVDRVSSIVSSKPVGANRWRVTVRYDGNRALTDLSFKLKIERSGNEPLVITQHRSGILYPNSTFYVDFESDELDAYRTYAQSVSFIYDNVRAL
ncbi:MAG: M48 family metallopeptidase [Pyrinomonadaceae bacterium]